MRERELKVICHRALARLVSGRAGRVSIEWNTPISGFAPSLTCSN